MTQPGSATRQHVVGAPTADAASAPRVDAADPWVVDIVPVGIRRRRAHESIATVADASFGTRALAGLDGSVSWPALFAAGMYTGDDVPELLAGPVWTTVKARLDPPWEESVRVDLRHGIVRHRWDLGDASIELRRFMSAADCGVAVQRVDGPIGALEVSEPLVRPEQHGETSVTSALIGGAEVMTVRDSRSGAAIAAAAHDEVRDTSSSRTVVRVVGLGAGEAAGAPGVAAERLRFARATGPAELTRRHRAAWDRRWERCGTWFPVRSDLERAVRFATFHLLCAGSGAERETAIGVRGLTGTAYRGHVFWDTDVFVVPALSAIAPDAAGRALDYRWARLGPARARARSEGRRGARFPWESAAGGEEATPRMGPTICMETASPSGPAISRSTSRRTSPGPSATTSRWTGDDDYLVSHGHRPARRRPPATGRRASRPTRTRRCICGG